MRAFTKLAIAPLLLTASVVNAEVIDFVDMIEQGPYGESAWAPLNLAFADFGLSISATKNGAAAFAYLDWNHAGLGVCGSAGNTNGAANTLRPGAKTNICNPSSDDNVTVGEALNFTFDTDVVIDKIWFNNTHDPDFTIVAPDLITIVNGGTTTHLLGPGNGYAPTSNKYNTGTYAASVDNWLGSFSVAAGQQFTVAYNNEQFYISGMEVRSVPEPGILALLVASLLGLNRTRRRPSPA